MRNINAFVATVCRRNFRRLAATALASCALFGASANTFLIIHFTDGSKTEFVLADRPVVSFADNMVRVRAQHIDTDFDASRVAKFTFGDESTAIKAVEANETRFTIVNPNHVSACGLKAGEKVKVFTVDGRTAMTVAADGQGSIDVNLSSLQQGVLIIATESGQTIKIKH